MVSLIESAKKEVQISDHIIYVTMNMLNDKKLLISAINHLEKAIEHIMINELRNTRKPVPTNKELLKDMFSQIYLGPKYILEIIDKLTEMSKTKQKEQICYLKNNDLIIVTTDYKTKVISEEEIKMIITQLKDYLRDKKWDTLSK